MLTIHYLIVRNLVSLASCSGASDLNDCTANLYRVNNSDTSSLHPLLLHGNYLYCDAYCPLWLDLFCISYISASCLHINCRLKSIKAGSTWTYYFCRASPVALPCVVMNEGPMTGRESETFLRRAKVQA